MGAVYKKELKSYFSSPIGFVFIAVVFFLSGIFFLSANILAGTADMSGFFSSYQEIIIFLIPMLTMRIWSDEKRNRTDQALLTAPVGLTRITLGKYFAALTVYGIAASVTIIYALTLASVADVDSLVIVSNVFGMLLVGMAMVAVGMFISNLTESQVVAAVLTFGVALLTVLMESIALVIPWKWLANAVINLSVFSRYNDFSVGMFNFSDVLYYVSHAVIFLFLTVRALENRRWR